MAERENTLEAFRRAFELGSDAVELDVRRTADGILVVHHDPELDDGRLVGALRAGEIPSYVPTLEAALEACTGMWVNLDIKNDPEEPDFDPSDSIADQTVECIRARNEDDRWLISSFRIEIVDRCKALAEGIRTAWLVYAVPGDVIATMVAHGHDALHPWVVTLSRSDVDVCHAAGIEVTTWTCDNPRRMSELIDWEIDGICTNVPDVARRVIARRQRTAHAAGEG